ncbi:hypothetical protein EZS27_029990 [termite gut metagenome]|uniref:Uncharacterized protein n=1 Tax=termite gut metagenome TaxID=433724 RepID=A0A5J4QFD9_9ZZZZ
MIQIKEFAQMLQDIRGKINQEFTGKITGTVLSVHPEAMIKKLKDKNGIYLCAGYPSCETDVTDSDSYTGKDFCVLFLLEKTAAGSLTTEEELNFYADMQKIGGRIQEILLSDNQSCDYGFSTPKKIRFEWEYNTFGGWNGISLGFEIES